MSDLIEPYDVVFFDLDGVLYLGPVAVEGAVEAVEKLTSRGVRSAYVTNNAARSTQVVADHLAELGFPAREPEVISSAQAAASVLSRELPAGARVLVTGSENLANLVTEAGLVVVDSADDGPVAVVQGYDPSMTWPRLDEAAYAVQRGARWVATNTDSTRPTERGLVPGAGTMVAAVRATVEQDPEVVGKPHRPLMEEAVRRSGARRPLFVGDRIDTDIMGAHAIGIDSLLVLTGAHGVRDLCEAPAHGRPTFLGWDLASLFVPPRTATADADGVRCGAVRIEADGRGSARVHGDLTTREGQLDAAWALAQLCWAGEVSAPEAVLERLDLLP